MKKIEKFFKLFANCIPVKGFSRSIICDLQNSKLFYIPNDLYEIIGQNTFVDISKIKDGYDHKYDEIIDEYFKYLQELNLGFFTSYPHLFPELSKEWHYPSEISNVIIDFSSVYNREIEHILCQIESIYCKSLQMRFFEYINYASLESTLSFLNNRKSIITNIQLIIPYFEEFNEKSIISLIENHPRINSIIIYNSPYNKLIDSKIFGMRFCLFVKQNIIDEKFCGVINKEYLNINIKTFTESICYNSCLNKKVSIDKNGFIKNCPSMPEHYGNIKNTSLNQAINKQGFKKYWKTTKDQVEVCKDCEFRYICTDCRAYTERNNFNEEGLDLSKPLKCGYNPYTNEWEEWSSNPLKIKAIEYYKMQDLVNKDA